MKRNVPFVVMLTAVPAFAQQNTSSGSSSSVGDGVTFALLFIGGYFLPAIIGACRKIKNLGGTVTINVLLGWTVIGWIVALIWAMSGETLAEAKAKTLDYEKLAAALQAQKTNPPAA